MDQAIEVTGLTKTYATGKGSPLLRAVDGIEFTVCDGEVFGFLGPNGAGKTTTIRMLPVSAGRRPAQRASWGWTWRPTCLASKSTSASCRKPRTCTTS